MAKATKKTLNAAASDDGRKNRNFPKHSLEAVLLLPQKIQDEMAARL